MAATNSHKLEQSSNKTRTRREPSKPWDSVLDPYVEFIAELRNGRRPVPYRKIPALLKEKYGIEVAFNTVSSFVRARSKERKVSKIHPNFLKASKPPRSEGDDAVKRLRDKVVQPAANDHSWSELEVHGPLMKASSPLQQNS
jgi:hypothetical protein